MNLLFAEYLPDQVREFVGGIAVVITLTGTWLQWKRQDRLSDLEDAVKNGTLTPDAARQRERLLHWGGPVLTIVGVVLMILMAVS